MIHQSEGCQFDWRQTANMGLVHRLYYMKQCNAKGACCGVEARRECLEGVKRFFALSQTELPLRDLTETEKSGKHEPHLVARVAAGHHREQREFYLVQDRQGHPALPRGDQTTFMERGTSRKGCRWDSQGSLFLKELSETLESHCEKGYGSIKALDDAYRFGKKVALGDCGSFEEWLRHEQKHQEQLKERHQGQPPRKSRLRRGSLLSQPEDPSFRGGKRDPNRTSTEEIHAVGAARNSLGSRVREKIALLKRQMKQEKARLLREGRRRRRGRRSE